MLVRFLAALTCHPDPMMKRTPALTLALLLAASLCLSVGCVTEEQTTRDGVSIGSSTRTKPREIKDDDPLPLFASAVTVATGDMLLLSGQRQIRLAGIKAPGPGEPYFETSRRVLQAVLGRRIFRIVPVAGTKATSPVWEANILVPSLKDVKLGEGIVSPQGINANSVNCLLLANGLVRPRNISGLKFAPIDEDDGHPVPLSEDRNRAVQALFQRSAEIARQEAAGVYSGNYKP